MEIKPGDYCRLYEALRDKYIKDFYDGDITGIDPDSHYIWPLRFNQVKRLKHQTTVTTPGGKYNYGDDLIPVVLFGLTDSQGKHFHTKWREALKKPSIFSVTTEFLYKALVYVLDTEPFTMEKLVAKSPPLSKKELERKVEELKGLFFGHSPTLSNEHKIVLKKDGVDDKLAEAISDVIVNFLSSINEKKLLQAWQLLFGNGQHNIHWRTFHEFREFYYSDIRQIKRIYDVSVFNISTAHPNSRAHVFYRERCTFIKSLGYELVEALLKQFMTKEPEGGLTSDIIRHVMNPRNTLFTHKYFGIEKETWDSVFRQFDTDTITRVQEFRFVRIQGYWLIEEILDEDGVNSDIDFMRVDRW